MKRAALTAIVIAVAIVARPSVLVGLVVAAALFVPLELAWPLHRRAPWRAGWRTDLAHFLVNGLLSAIGVVVVVIVVGVPVRLLTPQGYRNTIGGLPAAAQFALALVVAEVATYWGHRATHQVAWLWRFHKVHHSSIHMDWLAAARLHPVDQVFIRSCGVVPLFALGFTRATFGAYLGVAAVAAIFVHANVRLRFGPLRWLVITPEYHHWHHADETEAVNKNFATLPIIDKVFGTQWLPARWPHRYGIGEPAPGGYLAQLA